MTRRMYTKLPKFQHSFILYTTVVGSSEYLSTTLHHPHATLLCIYGNRRRIIFLNWSLEEQGRSFNGNQNF